LPHLAEKISHKKAQKAQNENPLIGSLFCALCAFLWLKLIVAG
jgi:hypothetical protein